MTAHGTATKGSVRPPATPSATSGALRGRPRCGRPTPGGSDWPIPGATSKRRNDATPEHPATADPDRLYRGTAAHHNGATSILGKRV